MNSPKTVPISIPDDVFVVEKKTIISATKSSIFPVGVINRMIRMITIAVISGAGSSAPAGIIYDLAAMWSLWSFFYLDYFIGAFSWEDSSGDLLNKPDRAAALKDWLCVCLNLNPPLKAIKRHHRRQKIRKFYAGHSTVKRKSGNAPEIFSISLNHHCRIEISLLLIIRLDDSHYGIVQNAQNHLVKSESNRV
jgi:hypothetical protein